ncbi:MAG: Ni/Fe hydrogenase subunit gamma [Chloroflexi bacterium]|nr:Ni/Fe hydrogenase subunit gamma [Chloroflexota bacterium]
MADTTFAPTQTMLDPMLPEIFQITRVVKETYDTFTLEMRPSAQRHTFPFEAGQFNMLYVYGVGEIPISISGDPGHTERLTHTTRTVGTVTKAMQALRAGDTLGVRGPFGTAWPVDTARTHDVVLVAGGIGLAPLRPALYQILNRRDEYGKIVLLYGTRSPEDILFRKELEQWRARFDLEIHVTVDYAGDVWHGNVGVVTRLIPKAPFDPAHTVAMICGPEVMMRFAAAELLKRGLSADCIYVSMERNMKCAVGFCGHCQFGPVFVCRDGPVFPFARVQPWINRWEI